MLPSPSAGVPSPSTAAGTKRPAAAAPAGGVTPSKRQATTTTAAKPSPAAAAVAPAAISGSAGPARLPQAPPAVTEEQLVGRTAEQLISTILQVQAQHQQSVAAISAQYESVSQQLSELRGSLAAFFNGQAASHQAVASQLQQASQGYAPRPAGPLSGLGPGAPALAQQAAPPPGPPRPPPSHPTNRPSRPPPQSPQAHADNRLVQKPGAQTPQTPGPPAYDYRTVGTVEEVWKEYREGMDGQPAIEELDSTWGSRWRPEPRGRTWYSRRKVIWDKIKEYVGEGMDEQSAVKEVEKLRDGGTINKLIRMLQDERKDKGITDDSIGA